MILSQKLKMKEDDQAEEMEKVLSKVKPLKE